MCFHVVESNRPRGWRRNEITGAGVRASSRLAIFQNCQGKLSASEDITGGGRARRTKKPSRQPKFLVSCAQMDQVVGLVFTRMQSAVWMEQSRFVDGVKTPRPAPPPTPTDISIFKLLHSIDRCASPLSAEKVEPLCKWGNPTTAWMCLAL